MMARTYGSGLVAAALLAGVAGGCDRNQQAAGAAGPAMPPALVRTTPVVSADVPVYLDEIGKTVAMEMVEIRPQVSGQILSIKFKDGADVGRGEELFQIEPASYEAALAQANASLKQNQAQLDLAKLDFERIKDLPRSVVSQQDYDAKKSAIDVAQALVDASKAAIKVASVKVGYTSIRSPLDGRAGQRLVDQGNIVSDTNPTPMLVVQKIDPIYADFTVTENDLPEVRRRMMEHTLKAEVRLPEDTKAYFGDLTFLDNAVQDGSGTVKLRATVPNREISFRSVAASILRPIVSLVMPKSPILTRGILRPAPLHFWPGQFVKVRLVLHTLPAAPLIPSVAVQIGQKGPYVYVVKPDSTAEQRAVVLGQRQGSDVVILEGAKAGERVIITGTQLVMPGGPVQEAPPEPGSTPPKTVAVATSNAKTAAAQPGKSVTPAKEGGTK